MMRVATGLALAAAALPVAGCGGQERASGPTGPLRSTASSWVAGQSPLTASAAYLRIAARADTLGERRAADYAGELARIEERIAAAQRRERREALDDYERRRRAALGRYRVALRAAARRRAELAALRRRQLAEAERRRRELLRKLRVEPGDECSIPEVREQFDCLTGRLPVD